MTVATRIPPKLSLLLVVVLLVVMTAATANAETRRYAVLIGATAGDGDEAPLLYAEDDARRIGTILRDLGGFAPEDIVTLTDVDASEVRRVLIRMNARVRQTKESMLFVFYSGHGDSESLHLGGSRLSMTEFAT